MPDRIQQTYTLRRNSQTLLILATIFLLVWWLPTPVQLRGLAQYPAVHTAMETLSIAVALLVFSATWNAYQSRQSGSLMLLSSILLAVGLIDFAHMLSFKGMPDFVTPGDPEKAINFWLAARFLAACGLLGMATLSRFRGDSTYSRHSYLVVALAITALVYWAGLFHQQAMPATFIEGQGLTRFKIQSEIVIVAVLMVAAIIFFRQAKQGVSYDAANLFAAVAVSILSELCFMLYKDVADLFNVLGHIYKIVAYLYIYQAVFVETVRHPYERLAETQHKLMLEQEAISRQSAMLGLFYDLPFIGMAITSPLNKRWLTVNDYLCQMLGYSRAELLEMTWAELTHPDDLQKNIDQFQHLMTGETDHYVMDKRFLRKDGTTIYTTINIQCIRQPDGTVKEVVATLQDISERYHLEQLQRQNLQKFETIANASPVLFWTSGLDKGCDWFNERWLDFTGRTNEQEVGNGWTEGVYPEDFEHCLSTYVSAFDNRQPFSMEYRLRRSDGEYRWLLDQGMPRYNADGEFIGYIGSCLDITEEKNIQNRLHTSEERLRLALQAANQGIYDLNVDTGEAIVSPEYALMLGYDPDTFHETNTDWVERLHPEDREHVAQNYRGYITGEIPEYRVEFRQRMRSGEWKWILSQGRLVEYTTNGQPLRMLGTHTDIDKLKQVEQKLIEREAFYRGVIEASVDSFWLVDAEGHLLQVSDSYVQRSGYNHEELMSMSIADVDAQMDESEIAQRIQKLILEKHGLFESTHRAKDGTIWPVEVNTIFMPIAGGRFFSFIRDISERKQIENKLLSSEASLKEAQRLSNIGSWELDLINNRLVWSDEVFRIFEMESSEGGSYEAFLQTIHPQDRTLVDTAYLESVKTKSDYNIVHRLLMPDGRIKYVHERAETFYNQNQAIRSMGTVQDITQAKLVEEELRLYREQLEFLVKKRTTELEAVNHELETFAYSVSHDLRAPLRGIDGFSQALLEDYASKLDDTGRNYLDRIRAASQRMGLLIDEMLKLSRITRATIKYNQVDLSSLAEVVLQQLQESMPEHRVETSIKAGILGWGDSGLLKIALENLLGNAWKYSAKQPNPRIEFGNLIDNEEIVYYIRDNGVGFDMQYADKLFGAFQRLHHREQFEGMGIGLATVKRIIHRHGGRVWATSEPNTKTTFFFTLANEAPN